MVYLTGSIHLERHDHVLKWMKSVSFDCHFLHSRYLSMLSLLLFLVAGIPFIMPPSPFRWKSYDLDSVGFGYALLWRFSGQAVSECVTDCMYVLFLLVYLI
ncbi:uncharacterized protein BO87DRAFT_239730 [Aspergillus neoniger CBS 115656]|uniref:Uncharacterized protein n=1 Tax=Aspergillus neoniger (strain CBS 115656) TaxID=1448310 RepID=A0A318Z896_ASPNB|nr:hypothetical protein BO87DRAFT_239730 [Aspergillus neoniger CBS 115656]PYH36468.1 hypothetical protein BO87DRAFT_239730 [Aspergillus neoniger CBS 115656]